jgi:hypothetical protein
MDGDSRLPPSGGGGGTGAFPTAPTVQNSIPYSVVMVWAWAGVAAAMRRRERVVVGKMGGFMGLVVGADGPRGC